MSEYEQVIDEIVKHGVVVKVNKIVDDNYIPYERKYVGCVVELDFSEHDKVFENKIAELKKDYETVSELLGKYQRENEALKKRIDELEKELSSVVKEAERKEFIREMSCLEIQELKQRISELESKETETCEKEPISDDCRPSMEWYENRHQSDCIEINRLNTTIDVLIHKIEYLRQFAGLE